MYYFSPHTLSWFGLSVTWRTAMAIANANPKEMRLPIIPKMSPDSIPNCMLKSINAYNPNGTPDFRKNLSNNAVLIGFVFGRNEGMATQKNPTQIPPKTLRTMDRDKPNSGSDSIIIPMPKILPMRMQGASCFTLIRKVYHINKTPHLPKHCAKTSMDYNLPYERIWYSENWTGTP